MNKKLGELCVCATTTTTCRSKNANIYKKGRQNISFLCQLLLLKIVLLAAYFANKRLFFRKIMFATFHCTDFATDYLEQRPFVYEAQ